MFWKGVWWICQLSVNEHQIHLIVILQHPCSCVKNKFYTKQKTIYNFVIEGLHWQSRQHTDIFITSLKYVCNFPNHKCYLQHEKIVSLVELNLKCRYDCFLLKMELTLVVLQSPDKIIQEKLCLQKKRMHQQVSIT